MGNLSHHLSEPEFARHFLRFGELESVAFQPGRSYAFVNFLRDDEAIDAMEALQGVAVDGSPLRIEFAKAVSLAFLLRIFTSFSFGVPVSCEINLKEYMNFCCSSLLYSLE